VGFLSFITLGFALGSMYVQPNDKDMLSLFGLIFPYIYFCALFILPFTYARHKLTFIVGVFLLCFGLKSFLSYLKPGIKNQHKSEDLHVLSFNAMMGFKMVNEHHQFKESNQEALNALLRLKISNY